MSCILEDERSNLWMSTNNGLSKFDPFKQTFKNYSTADGLPGADLTGWGACYKSSSGEMFFGGFSGGIAFHPDRVVDDPYVPPAVLTDFRLFDRPVTVGGDSPLTKSIGYTNALSLSHDKNIFSLEFSALSYFNPATNRYRYKLEGLDRQWHEVGSNQRLVTYTTLPAGMYTFHVQGATSRGAWSEPGSALSIEILPPWWKRWWFITIYSAMTLLLAWWVHHYRLRQVAQQYNTRLAERIAERTRIARELHDTLLQSFQGVLLKLHVVTYRLIDHPEAQKTLEDIIEQGREAVTEGREAVQGLRASTVIKNDLACALTTVGERLAAEQNVESPVDFHVAVEGESRDLHPILRDEAYRIASEAICNAFRHSEATRIDVEIRYDEKQFRVRIRDNGEGIDPKVLDGGAREGHYGLPGMRERAKLARGKLTVRSKLDSGTEVELTIPASIAYAKSSAPSPSIS